MNLVLLLLAAALFATGGLFMKYSEGLTQFPASAAVFLLFCGGAACQAVAMKRAEMGVIYAVVLGLEAILAFLLSVFLLGERATAEKLFALALIVAGIVLFERT